MPPFFPLRSARRAVRTLACLLSACSVLAWAPAQAGETATAFVATQAGQDAAAAAARLPIAPFEALEYTTSNGVRLSYRLLPPPQIKPGERYPLVVMLHGSGGMGNDNESQLGGLARSWAAPDLRTRYPAYVLVPQTRTRTARYSRDSHGVVTAEAGPALADVLAAIAYVRDSHAVDPQRIYAVGFSMGASAALQAALAKPDLFAGIVAIAAVPPSSKRAAAAATAAVPLWLVHGDADDENPYAGSQAWYRDLSAAGAPLEFHTYTGMDHRVPPDMLTGQPWRDWLFAQRRRPPEAAPGS